MKCLYICLVYGQHPYHSTHLFNLWSIDRLEGHCDLGHVHDIERELSHERLALRADGREHKIVLVGQFECRLEGVDEGVRSVEAGVGSVGDQGEVGVVFGRVRLEGAVRAFCGVNNGKYNVMYYVCNVKINSRCK